MERSIDKLHRTGKYDQATKTQPVIVKFTSHSFKEQVYFKRKTIKNSGSNIRITPSLTCHWLESLNLTQSYLQEEYYNKKEYPKFTFADVHGNLKLALNLPLKNRSVFSFSSVFELHWIITKVTTQLSYPYEDEIYDDGDEEANWLKLVVNVDSWIGLPLTSWCWDAARITFPLFSWKYLSSMMLSHSLDKAVWWGYIHHR